ncbi:hypothetical protein [Halovenus sp. HT40]|jgi:hypothetical protein
MVAAVETVGPFLIPIVIFILGLIGYLVLFVLTRWGILGDD